MVDVEAHPKDPDEARTENIDSNQEDSITPRRAIIITVCLAVAMVLGIVILVLFFYLRGHAVHNASPLPLPTAVTPIPEPDSGSFAFFAPVTQVIVANKTASILVGLVVLVCLIIIIVTATAIANRTRVPVRPVIPSNAPVQVPPPTIAPFEPEKNAGQMVFYIFAIIYVIGIVYWAADTAFTQPQELRKLRVFGILTILPACLLFHYICIWLKKLIQKCLPHFKLRLALSIPLRIAFCILWFVTVLILLVDLLQCLLLEAFLNLCHCCGNLKKVKSELKDVAEEYLKTIKSIRYVFQRDKFSEEGKEAAGTTQPAVTALVTQPPGVQSTVPAPGTESITQPPPIGPAAGESTQNIPVTEPPVASTTTTDVGKPTVPEGASQQTTEGAGQPTTESLI